LFFAPVSSTVRPVSVLSSPQALGGSLLVVYCRQAGLDSRMSSRTLLNHRHQEFQIKNDATVYPDRLGTKTRKVKWVKTDRGVFSPLHGDADVVLRGLTSAEWHDVAPEGLVAPAGNGLLCQLLLCLSRACLGKSIVCSAKIAPKGCFPYVLSRSESVQGRYGSGQQHM
jgi:hypothetical protein